MKYIKSDTLNLVVPIYALVTVFIFLKTAQIVNLPYIYSLIAIVFGLAALLAIPFSSSIRTVIVRRLRVN